jgi:hypothetical protein
VTPVRYELGFYIAEDCILHSHCSENLKSYIEELNYHHCLWSGISRRRKHEEEKLKGLREHRRRDQMSSSAVQSRAEQSHALPGKTTVRVFIVRPRQIKVEYTINWIQSRNVRILHIYNSAQSLRPL